MDKIRMALDQSGMVGVLSKKDFKSGARLEEIIIHHEVCHGTFSFRGISRKENALFCPECGGRITFPSEVQTARQLNKHLELKGVGIKSAVVKI